MILKVETLRRSPDCLNSSLRLTSQSPLPSFAVGDTLVAPDLETANKVSTISVKGGVLCLWTASSLEQLEQMSVVVKVYAAAA
jgi:hypothetical protein